ncbi:hypothetical protein [Haloarchaeobius sp. HRN-SO-5]|uniref:hypothetical protein n=1 Tax=Haloarchaeobius sp. HRN-SO-5 TaxID=3446118 RepID=UPI003EBEC470
MPTVQKTSGGRVTVRDIGEFTVGDQAAVSDAEAQYLVDERGDFTLVDGEDEATADDLSKMENRLEQKLTDDTEEEEEEEEDLAAIIDDGTCPWCADYEGDAVGKHASSAHSEEWNDYKQQREG